MTKITDTLVDNLYDVFRNEDKSKTMTLHAFLRNQGFPEEDITGEVISSLLMTTLEKYPSIRKML